MSLGTPCSAKTGLGQTQAASLAQETHHTNARNTAPIAYVLLAASIGTLPESIGELSNLRELNLDNNSFTGELKTNPGSVLFEPSHQFSQKISE